MVNKIIFTIIGLFFIVMFFVIINKLNKNKETKNKTLYNILGFGFLSFLLLFLLFQKDLSSRIKENVKNNKVEKVVENKKQEEPKENKEEEKPLDVKEEKKTEVEPLVELLNKIKENSYGFGKDYKIIISDGNRYMPNVLYFQIEYAGFKTREYYFAKSEKKGTIEVFNSIFKKEFKILEKYGKNDEEFNRVLLEFLKIDSTSNELKKSINESNLKLDEYVDSNYFKDINVRYVVNKEIKDDPMGKYFLPVVNNGDYISIVLSTNEKWDRLVRGGSNIKYFETIMNDKFQMKLIGEILKTKFIQKGEKRDFIVSISNTYDKDEPNSFYVVYSATLDAKGNIYLKEEAKSVD